ncbi:MAG TPA: hypothetical protein VFL76_03850 [Edaphocola sp.]|nr:hypothetical protein [Edaphocola sp.]
MSRFFLVFMSLCWLPVNFSYGNPFQNGVPGIKPAGLQKGSFHIDISGGLTLPFSDVDHLRPEPAFDVMGGYNFSYGLSVQASLTKGWMNAGEKNEEDRYFLNNYWSENFIIRFNPMAIWRPQVNSAPNFYLGTGIALVQSYTTAQYRPGKAGGYKGNYDGNDLFIPAEAGINIPVAEINNRSDRPYSQFLDLNINYRYYFGFTDSMDGYSPLARYNKHNDSFSIFSVGLSYVF